MASNTENLTKFLSNIDWSKYINDAEVQQLAESLSARVTALVGNSMNTSTDEDGEGDLAGATRIKLVVVGDGAVGKTALMVSYATNIFPTDYLPTVFENYTAKKKRGDETILLQLRDTAGQEEYDRLRPLSYPGADVVLLCFSTVSLASYDSIRDKWAPEVSHFINDVPRLLVGTKIDLHAAQQQDPNAGKYDSITYEMGQSMANQIKASKYLEVSAKTRQGLDVVFSHAIDLALSSRGVAHTTEAGVVVKPVKQTIKKNKNHCILM